MINLLKKHKRLLLTLGIVSLVFVLSACAPAEVEPIGPNSEGFWDGVIIYNFSRFIIWISEIFGGNYGIGIIIITIISRIILLPLTQLQNKNMAQMNDIQPEMKALQEKYSARDAETKAKLQEEQEKLYEEHGINPLMGCLPLIVQMPIFIAVYQAVSRTPQLANESFLWVNLGEPDPYFIFPILAGLFTLLNSLLMQYGKEGMSGKIMSFIMPLFIILITFQLSSGLALYFTVSNIFGVLQTLVLNNPFKRVREEQEKEELEKEKERRRKKAIKKAKKYGRNYKK